MVTISEDLARRLLAELDKEIEIAEPKAFSDRAREDLENLWSLSDELKAAIDAAKKPSAGRCHLS